jgi:hypothetical protein
VPVFADDLIEDVAGVDDVKLPSDTTSITVNGIWLERLFPRVRLDTEEGTRDAMIGGDDVLNSFLLDRILA